MISEKEKPRLRAFLGSPDYQTVIKIAEQLKDSIKKEGTIKDTEWETLKATIDKEGRLRGIDNFIKELFTNSK